MSKTLFSFENVRIAYGREEIIHGVDFSLSEGEFCALLGLNGSGKTTMLHAACGFVPMTGRCVVCGMDCQGMHERQRARLMAFIPQTSSIYGGKSVLEVVMMGFNARLGLLESPSAEHRRIALDTLGRLGYATIADKDFGTLSQGQKQVVALARCIVQDTPVMLMDEPDSALDFLNRHMVLGKIRDMVHASGKAGLITLHDPNFAINYCDRILMLKDGRIAADMLMAGAGADEIRDKLSIIYGPVDVMKHESGFLMWRR